MNDNFNLQDREEELPHSEEPVSSPQRLPHSLAAASYSRTLQEGAQQKAGTASPQSRASKKYLREPGLIMQPTKQAQIVKTNQHLSSIQPGARMGSSQCHTKTQSSFQHLPQSPLPIRHAKIQHVDGTSTLSSGSVPTGPSAELYDEFISSQCSCSQHDENLSSHSSRTADRLTAPAQKNFSEARQQGPGTSAVSAASPSSSVILASSTSSLTSAGSFSDNVKGPDVRLKENNVNQVQGSIAEHRPRNTPFMGIMDKTARFQQQNAQASRTWHSQAADGLSTTSGGIQSSNFEHLSVKQHQTKIPCAGAAPGDGNQNGVQAKDRDELKCQISAHPQDNTVPKTAAHLHPDALSGKEAHLSHVTAAKPKRSFIESNV